MSLMLHITAALAVAFATLPAAERLTLLPERLPPLAEPQEVPVQQQTPSAAEEPAEFPTLMVAGALALQNGDFEVALEAFEAALELQPDDPMVLSQVGRALTELEYFDEAMPMLSQAAQLAPDSFVTQFNLGTALLRTEKHRQAISWLGAAVALRPEEPLPRYGLALAHAALGDHRRAIAQLEECVAVAPDSTDAWLLLGRLHSEHAESLDSVLKATEAFERVFELRPHEGETCLALGRAYRRLSLPEQAIDLIGQCEAAGVQDARLYLLKGRMLSQMGEVALAREALLASSNGPQAEGAAYLDLAVISRTQGDFETAIEEYQRTIRLRPRVITAYVHLAEIYVNRQQPEAAAELLTRAIRLVPRSPAAHEQLCQLQRETGELASAEAYCRRAIELDPDLLDAYYTLALLLRDRGQADESRRTMELYQARTAAAERQELEANRLAQVALANAQGLYYFRQDDLERALGLFESAAELAADDWLVAFNLGMANAALGRHEDSVAALERSRQLNPGRFPTYPLLVAELRALGRHDEATRVEALGADLEQ